MDALEFLRERKRMCNSFNMCSCGCPAWDGSCKLATGAVFEWEADKQVEIVNEWAAEHPRKTRQSIFLEQFPNVLLDINGMIDISPCRVDSKQHPFNGNDCCKFKSCGDCRREFWMQEVE